MLRNKTEKYPKPFFNASLENFMFNSSLLVKRDSINNLFKATCNLFQWIVTNDMIVLVKGVPINLFMLAFYALYTFAYTCIRDGSQIMSAIFGGNDSL